MLHRRLWASRLWILAGLLGLATVILTMSIVHDSRRLRAAARSVAESTAGQVAALAAGRLEVLALETFAPATPWDTRATSSVQATLHALIAAQDAAGRCTCRDTLPADWFFRFAPATGALDILPRGAVTALPDAALDSAIARLARSEAARATDRKLSSVHLVAGPALGTRAAVTIAQFDSSGRPAAIYGLVGSARWVTATLFEHESPSALIEHTPVGLLRLDTLSVQVATTAGAPVLGVIGAEHRIRGTSAPTSGPLEGLTITVGLTSVQVPMSMFVSRPDLFHLGILIVCTVLVIGFAVGSSRRELLLARARSDFIAGVSHDLRMPLAQILIAGETLSLERERDADDRRTLAGSIVREARRLVGLVDNVMLFSRSGAVALRAQRATVHVPSLFDEVIDAVRLAVDDARQSIEVTAPELSLDTDRRLVRQALVNLVDNALKYGAPGQHIRIGALAAPPASVRLFVEDEGPGIPASDRDRLFGAYERLGRDQASERTGAGLGLAVVKQIVSACGGRVWLESGATRGTRAVIELPAAAPAPAPETVPA